MDFSGTTSSETAIGWLKGAMIVCFASAAGVMAYAIIMSETAPPMAGSGSVRITQPN